MQLQINRQDGAIFISDGELRCRSFPSAWAKRHERGERASGCGRRRCSTSGSALPAVPNSVRSATLVRQGRRIRPEHRERFGTLIERAFAR
jgi:hypothetical protein